MTRSIAFFVIISLICPILILLSYLFYEAELTWLFNILFHRYVLNTLILGFSVGIITAILGTISAMSITFFDFPGKNFFQFLLLLPLAFPAYITAFTYGYVFEFAGPVQTFLREYLGWHYFPNIRSLGGAILVMSLAFYPYVYMLMRANFVALGDMISTARMMGKSTLRILLEVILPISRPALASGVSLVIMEVIADFGTPQFFSVDTFTTGIYRTWFLLNDYPSAARLSCIILTFVFFLLFIERRSRRHNFYNGLIGDKGVIHKWKLKKRSHKFFIYSFCCIVPFMGFFIPMIQLIYWSIEVHNLLDISILYFIGNSVMIATCASLIIVGLAIFLAYCIRLKQSSTHFIRLAHMGYALPSSVIAIGIMIFLGTISKYISILSYKYFGLQIHVMLIGTTFALLYAYTIRFLSVSMGAMESGFSKIPREFDWASSMLGHNSYKTCISIHVPMLIKSIIVAFLLTFIDVVKELSATLIVRPFNFETVATRTYDLIMDERYREASFPALVLMMIGMFSILLMTKFLKGKSLSENNNYVKDCNAG